MDRLAETVAAYDRNAVEYATRWWSSRLDRQMSEFEALRPGDVVLDLGCGVGRDTQWLVELGHRPIGVDLSIGMLTEAVQRVPDTAFVRSDLRALPFSEESADGAWVCSSLVHVEPSGACGFFEEAARVLRDRAPIYIGVESGEGHEERTDLGRRHYYLWSPADLAHRLRQAGFHIIEQYLEHVQRTTYLTTLAVRHR